MAQGFHLYLATHTERRKDGVVRQRFAKFRRIKDTSACSPAANRRASEISVSKYFLEFIKKALTAVNY